MTLSLRCQPMPVENEWINPRNTITLLKKILYFINAKRCCILLILFAFSQFLSWWYSYKQHFNHCPINSFNKWRWNIGITPCLSGTYNEAIWVMSSIHIVWVTKFLPFRPLNLFWLRTKTKTMQLKSYFI